MPSSKVAWSVLGLRLKCLKLLPIILFELSPIILLCLAYYSKIILRRYTLPRPILVSFNRAIDVSTLLSKTSSLPNGIQIKRDMTKDERLVESILVKERWALIQKKTERKSIKISGNKIFINNKLTVKVRILALS